MDVLRSPVAFGRAGWHTACSHPIPLGSVSCLPGSGGNSPSSSQHIIKLMKAGRILAFHWSSGEQAKLEIKVECLGKLKGIWFTCLGHTFRSKAVMRLHIKGSSPACQTVRGLLLGKGKDLADDVACFLESSGKPAWQFICYCRTKDIGKAFDKLQRDKYKVQYNIAYSALKYWCIKLQVCSLGSFQKGTNHQTCLKSGAHPLFFSYV